MVSKKDLSEQDIRTKFITPAIEKAGWDRMTQLGEDVPLTDGKIFIRGNLFARGKLKRADYVLYYKPNIPIAIIEAKDNNHSVRSGIQQALGYRELLKDECLVSLNNSDELITKLEKILFTSTKSLLLQTISEVEPPIMEIKYKLNGKKFGDCRVAC